MKIKFVRALLITILALIVFLATTFIPWLRGSKIGDFLQGFSLGVGLLLSIFIIGIKKSKIQLAVVRSER
jgi:hypothetical protein